MQDRRWFNSTYVIEVGNENEIENILADPEHYFRFLRNTVRAPRVYVGIEDIKIADTIHQDGNKVTYTFHGILVSEKPDGMV